MFLCFHLRPACFSDSWNKLVSGFTFVWVNSDGRGFPMENLDFCHGFPMVFQAKMESDLLPFSDASTTDADSMSRCSRCVQLDEAWKHSGFTNGINGPVMVKQRYQEQRSKQRILNGQ